MKICSYSFVVESEKHVTCYVEDIIVRMINKSKFWRVYQIDANIYEVTDQKKNGIVHLQSHLCTCGK